METNFNDVFLRDLSLGVMNEFFRKVRWVNVWDDRKELITVPVYYGMTGDEKFLLDAYVDDIVGKRPELNIDPIPRAHFVLDNSTIVRDQYTNPNVDMIYYKEIDGVLTKLQGMIRRIPIKATYSIEFRVNKEIDLMKCYQSLWDFFFAYKYFYIMSNSIRVDSIISIPDDKSIEILREIEGIKGASNIKKIKFNFDVFSTHIVEPISAPQTIDANQSKRLIYGRTRNLQIVEKPKVYIGSDVNQKTLDENAIMKNIKR
jgi:hypothetical protein